ncbi:MAG: EI24 domain-containing protein [Erythrobacter sp.]
MSAVIASLAKAIGQLSDRAIWRVVLKSVAITLAAFVLFGALLWWGVDRAIDWGLAVSLPDGARGAAAGVLAVVLWLVSFWLLFRVVALAVLQFFADEIVAAVEARHYPDAAARARPLPLRRDIANSLRSIARAVAVNALALPFAAVLVFTAIGPALVFLAANAWLLGRELTDMAWLRHCGEAERANPVPRGQRVLLGGAIAAAMLVPFANLIAPIIGAAAGTHLTQRAMTRPGANRPAKDVSHA